MMILYHAIKTIQNRVFVIFKNKLLLLFNETQKMDYKKQQGCFCWKKTGFSQPWLSFNSFLWFSFDRTVWNKSRHYQFDWVCAAHLD